MLETQVKFGKERERIGNTQKWRKRMKKLHFFFLRFIVPIFLSLVFS